MTLAEVKIAFDQQMPCEVYSSGTGWTAWLDRGWHPAMITEIDEQIPLVWLSIPHSLIEVRVVGLKDIERLLRLRGA
ncbi:MAG: hypothetical protein JO202_01660 [Ktedonobacteraceae bacterium]|nr:hypothetical protein [Ktedonobacteraceae bacterium]